MRVIWSLQARKSLQEIYLFIKKESPAAAVKVRKTIIDITRRLPIYPDKHPSEPANDTGKNIRFVPKWDYKIIFEIQQNRIVIIDIFHTSQHPDKLKL